jgi:Fic family protein/DNA-binding XRE family transcriptional regulator
MTPKEKLGFIMKMSGLTQAELANRLGVTFAALNRWINDKAIPRPKSLEKIDELYREYSGEKQVPETVAAAKRGIVKEKQKQHPRVLKEIIANPDIRDEFCLSLTYHSNRIEGSTLSENETAAIMFQNAALPNKSFVEQLEVKNHQAALAYLFEHLERGKPVDDALVLKLHSILMNAVRSDAGMYRDHGVRIMGAHVPTANYIKVPALMKELFRDTNLNRKGSDVINHIAQVHTRFEAIHPFADGNGRTGRLLMHAMALQENLSPLVILQENRRLYMAYLNKAQTKDDFSLLADFVCDAILDGYRIIERDFTVK